MDTDSTTTPPNYRAWLVRCWQTDEQLRFVVESVADGRRNGFGDVSQLVQFLMLQLDHRTWSDDDA